MERKPAIRPLRLPKEIWGTLTPYFRVMKEAKAPVKASLTLNTLSGLLEGSALVALIPIINHLTLSDATPKTKIMARLGFDFLTNTQQIALGLIAFITLGLGFAVFSYLGQYVLAKVHYRVMSYTMSRTSAAMFSTSWPTFLGFKTGEIHKSMLIEGRNIGNGSQHVLMAIAQMGVAIIFLLLCAVISPYMTFVTLLFAAFGTLIYLMLGLKVQKRAAQLVSVEASLADLVSEIFESFKFFRLIGGEKTIRANLESRADDYQEKFVQVEREQFAIRLLAEASVVLFLTIFLVLGIFMFDIAPGAFLIFLAIFYRLIPRILNINSLIVAAQVELKRLVAWKERIAKAEQHKVINETSGKTAPRFLEKVEARGLSLRLPDRDELILKDISFSLERKEFLAVVGPSGCGKTTLTDCLAGLFPEAAKNIFIDGEPLSQIDLNLWQQRLGIVQQRNPIFYGTIWANIAWGDERVDMPRVIEAAQLAKAREFIDALPAGFETVVGRGGGALSVGQEQRLAIARAVYRKPDLLILDEATSALDASSEEYVLASIDGLRNVCAVLMVSHHLRAIKKADNILVLEKGRVVDHGRFEELITKPNSLFRELAKAQGIV